jgi:Pyridoxamine 5'-phosphate oxidase
MADVDLEGDIATAINGSLERGHAVVLGYVDDDGWATMSFRGSAQVHGRQQLAVWSRKRDEGLVTSIVERPSVSLLFYEPDGAGVRYLSIRGRAHVDPTANDVVYERMVEVERRHDPDRQGVAVIIDVDTVIGFGNSGPFRMERSGEA